MKKKYKSAKHAQEARQLAAEWEAMMASHNSRPFGTSGKAAVKEAGPPKLEVPRRATIMSLVTPGGSTALKATQTYTGGNMIGIAQMHKSNATPVFRKQDAIDISSMRR